MNKNRLLSLIFLIAFILIAINLNSTPLLSIDDSVNTFFSIHQATPLRNLSVILSIIFEPVYVILYVVILSTLLWFYRKRKYAILIFFTSAAAGASIYLLKVLFARARPLNMLIIESNFSFPSGHALISIVLFGILISFCTNLKSKHKNSLIVLYSFMILLVGLSRLYLNVHWFSDIMAGYCFGLFLIFGALFIYKKIKPNISQKRVVHRFSK